MAKKKKKQKPKQGHPARLQEGVVSMDRVKVERGLDKLTPQFVQWYSEYRDDPELALMVLAAIRETLSVYSEVVGLTKVTDFDPPKLLAVLNSMIEFEEAENPEATADELGAMIYMAWADYAEFLRDTDLWEREFESLDLFQKYLEEQDPFEANGFEADELDEIASDPQMAQAATEHIATMPISRFGRAVLTWISTEGKELWATTEMVEFFELAKKAVADDLPAGVDDARAPLITALALTGLEAADAIILQPNHAPELGDTYQQMLRPRGADAFFPNYSYMQACLDLLLSKPEEIGSEAVDAWGLANLWILEAIDGEPHVVASERGEQWTPEVWTVAHERMQELRSLGLVAEGPTYSLPEIVRVALTDLDDDEVEGEEFSDDMFESIFGPDGAEEPKRLKREEPYTGKVLQLKLGLKDTKPPIWRRVLVPMDLHLGDLHDIIQASFDWYDGHLHIFHSGGYGGTSYGPVSEFMEYDKAEAETPISSVLSKEKDRLDYSYDFGDGWEIRIDVEKILDADDGQLPRCTGGRRLAPMEDSGGVGGWEFKLETFNDPSHPEYDEVLEWFESFGISADDPVDPAHFDVDEINANLEAEF